MTETLTAAPVLAESPEDTLARLVAIANQTPYREVRILAPHVFADLGNTAVQETVTVPPTTVQRPNPELDHQPLTTRKYDNSLDTMERVLAGLQALPPEREGQAVVHVEQDSFAQPGLDDNPLITRKFSDDEDTMELILMGLRTLPGVQTPESVVAIEDEIQTAPSNAYSGPVIPGPGGARYPAPQRDTSPEATREKALGLIAQVREINGRRLRLRPAAPDLATPQTLEPIHTANDSTVVVEAAQKTAATATTHEQGIAQAKSEPEMLQESETDRRLSAAGFDLTGKRLEISDRLRRQAALRPKSEYKGLRRNYNTLVGRLNMLGRRVGSLAMRRMAPMGAGSDSLIAGIQTALTHLP